MAGNLPQLRTLFKTDSVKAQFQEMLKEKASSYMTSVITTVSNNTQLQDAEPSSIILAAAASAALDLPVTPSLGQAAIIPFKTKDGNKAQLQIMVNGWVALAKRSGVLETLTCEPVYEGELISQDRFHEDYQFIDTGCTDESKIIGYMCYMRETNGFQKTIYWTKEQILEHGKKYSKTFNFANSLWKTDFKAMARKTLIKHMLTKYATLSLEMQTAIERDEKPLRRTEDGEITIMDEEGEVIETVTQPKKEGEEYANFEEQTEDTF